MLQINFYPESDKEEFIKAAREYQEIWDKEGKKIIETIEKISGLKFKTKFINAVTFGGISYSLPLRLESSYKPKFKRAVLVHELCHRLLVDNGVKIKSISKADFTFKVHRIIYLVLYDIWVQLYGEKLAKEAMELEISYGYPPYKKAWDWALSFDKLERSKKFKEFLKKN